MATRSDELHSHQFALQRVVAAVALRNPDATTSPMRRIGGALIAGLMLAVLALAAAGIYGLLRPSGGDAWREGGSVIIERETGARFVYRDGILHPVLNYSSALLILGADDPPSAHVPRAQLVGVPRGAPLGIPGAPDLLPARQDLLTTPWTLCSRAPALPAPQTGPAGAVAAESVLLVGSAPDEGVDPLGARAVLAEDPGGGLHLIWDARRFPVAAPHLIPAAFGWSRQMAMPVATAVLNALPPGQPIDRPTVARSDRASAVPGYRIGEVFMVQTSAGERQFGVALADGLADITQLQADLLIADGANGLGGRPTEMGQAQYAAGPRAASLIPTSPLAPPAVTPELAHTAPQTVVCAAFADGVAAPQIVLADGPLRAAGEVRPGSAGDLAAAVDWVAVPPGRGAVVAAAAGPDDGALALVTDLGRRFPLADPGTLAMLGYADVTPLRLPAAVVALLPAGQALDPGAAMQPLAQ